MLNNRTVRGWVIFFLNEVYLNLCDIPFYYGILLYISYLNVEKENANSIVYVCCINR